MSQTNVEIVRRAWDAWIRSDLPGLLRECDPGVVWDTRHYRDWPEREYRGMEAVERFLTEWRAVWDDYEVLLRELRPAPDGRVVALYWHRGKGRHSGVPMEDEIAQVATVRERKITRLDIYDDQGLALEAVGLRE